jgi:hypothetical protein
MESDTFSVARYCAGDVADTRALVQHHSEAIGRDRMKRAAITVATAALWIGAGIGVSACGGEETTTTTIIQPSGGGSEGATTRTNETTTTGIGTTTTTTGTVTTPNEHDDSGGDGNNTGPG